MPTRTEKFQKFTASQVERLGSFNFDPGTLLWHYTTGEGLKLILESGTLFSTQVSCLNDSTEIRYSIALFKKALTELLSKFEGDDRVKRFLTRYLTIYDEDPEFPTHAPSPFFVACFTQQDDDVNLWRSYCSGENGYALGFKAGNLFALPNALVKVNYDKNLHEQIAMTVAEATIKFYEEELEAKQQNEEQAVLAEVLKDEEEPGETEFITQWDVALSYLSPLVKDPGFASENEYRVIHEFVPYDLRSAIFVQKKTMMTRHIPLSFPLGGEAWVPRLPIEKVMVGPCRHREITRISVDTLLRKMGYGGGKVFSSVRPFQET
jgi:hypothetical protein